MRQGEPGVNYPRALSEQGSWNDGDAVCVVRLTLDGVAASMRRLALGRWWGVDARGSDTRVSTSKRGKATRLSDATIETGIARLRALEHADVPAEHADEILDLCERLAQTDAGMLALVDAFSASASAVVTRALSFVLAQRAWQVTAANAGIVYRHVELLAQRDDATTLANTLTAIQRQCIAGQPWPPGRVPASLLPFFEHCVAQGASVRDDVERVLDCLRDHGHLSSTRI